MRLSVASAAVCLLTVGLSIADESHASIKRATHIPPEPLSRALQALAKERGFQVVYESAEVNPLQTQGASGDLTFEEALTQLLAGTALTYKFYGDNAVSIVPIGAASPAPQRAKPEDSNPGTESQQGDQKKPFWERFRLAQADRASSPGVGAVENSAPEKSSVYLEEVVVTAQKRSEALEVVPVSVSVLDAASMEQQHVVEVSDYLGRIPGLAANVSDQGNLSLAIRGITTGQGGGNPTVGVTIDDVPIGATAGLAGGYVPELDPAVLKSIEVLRGPQGTLYGASSMGGLLKYVTAPPELNDTHARFEVSGLSMFDGGDGYGSRAEVTTPLIADRLGITANAFFRRDPGYVSNSTTGARGVNGEDNAGGRVALLWQMAQNASLQVAALFQRLEGNGSSIVNVDDTLHPIDGLSHAQIVGAGTFNRDFQLYSANLKVGLGWGTLTSVTGYQIDTRQGSADDTASLGGLTSYATGQTNLGTLALSMTDTRKLSEEVRLESSPTEHLSLLGGLFYTREISTVGANIIGSDLTTGELVADVLPDFVPEDNYNEYAAFGDATYRFNDSLDVQVGARYAANTQEYHETITSGLLYGPPSTPYDVWAHSRDHATTYLFTPRWRISGNLMTYLRIASGYRPGGPNSGAPSGFPATFNSDTLTSYEAGVKGGGLLDGKLTFGVDVYRINWNRIQLQETDPATDFLYYVNGGKARSQGLEFQLSVAPVKGLVITPTLGFTDATLRQDLVTGLIGVTGDRLPYTAKWTASVDIQQTLKVTSSMSLFVGGNVRYLGDRPSDFSTSTSAPRLDLPAYTLLDLRAGAVINDWNISLFAQNVTNRFAVLGASPQIAGEDTGVNYALVQRPRTIGISVTRSL